MEWNRFVWVLTILALSFSCAVAHADSLPPGDPVIEINDPVCQQETPCAPLVGGPQGTTPFTFSADANGNGPDPGTNMFQVQSANGFFNLDIEAFVNFTDPTQIHCTSSTIGADGQVLGTPFQCNSQIFVGQNGAPNVADIFLSECEELCNGFPQNDVFTVSLQGWTPLLEFTATPDLATGRPTAPLISQVPEPASVFLISTGVAALLCRRRFPIHI